MESGPRKAPVEPQRHQAPQAGVVALEEETDGPLILAARKRVAARARAYSFNCARGGVVDGKAWPPVHLYRLCRVFHSRIQSSRSSSSG